MVRVSGENDHGAGRVGFELARLEFITQSDIKHAGNHSIDAIFRVLVRHQLRAVRRFDPDGVRARLRGLTHDDRQQDARRKLRERFPIDIIGQDSFENVLPELVRPHFALLSTLCAAGFLSHTILLRQENVAQVFRPEAFGSAWMLLRSSRLHASECKAAASRRTPKGALPLFFGVRELALAFLRANLQQDPPALTYLTEVLCPTSIM